MKSRPVPKKMRRSPLVVIGTSLLVLSVAALFFVFGVLLFGIVDYEEFSPYTMKRRRSTYFRLPLTNLQLTPASRVDATNALETFLVTQGYVTASTQPQRWDVVRVLPANRVGDAEYLCFYLDKPRDEFVIKAGDTPSWKTWSENNPEMAKFFWPIVIGLAQDELYTLVPELFEICQQSQDLKDLETKVTEHLAKKFMRLADNESQLAKPEAVVDVCSKGLKLLPKDPELLKKRAEAYRRLGQLERASADEKTISSTGLVKE